MWLNRSGESPAVPQEQPFDRPPSAPPTEVVEAEPSTENVPEADSRDAFRARNLFDFGGLLREQVTSSAPADDQYSLAADSGCGAATAVSPAASGDDLSPAEVETLALNNAPIFNMHPDEQYLPGDPDTFIANSSLRGHRPIIPDRGIADRGEVTSELLREQQGDDIYLDLEDDETLRQGDAANAPIMYQFDPGSADRPPTMTYWVFSPYNSKDLPGPASQNHEGDWERVTLVFDQNAPLTPDSQPVEIRYSAHGGATHLPWNEAPKDAATGRPVVYVARGSHAMSPYPHNQPIESVPGLEDEFAAGGVQIDAAGTRSDGSLRLENVTDQPWWGTRTHWGQRGDLAAFPPVVVIGGQIIDVPEELRNSTSGVQGPMPDPDGDGPQTGKGALGPTTRRPVTR